MSKSNHEDPTARMARLKNEDDNIFVRTYLGLLFSVEYALENFSNYAIFPQLKNNLANYFLRFKNIHSNFLRQNIPKYISYIKNARETEETIEETKQRRIQGKEKPEIIGPVSKKFLLENLTVIPLNLPKLHLQARIERVLKSKQLLNTKHIL